MAREIEEAREARKREEEEFEKEQLRKDLAATEEEAKLKRAQEEAAKVAQMKKDADEARAADAAQAQKDLEEAAAKASAAGEKEGATSPVSPNLGKRGGEDTRPSFFLGNDDKRARADQERIFLTKLPDTVMGLRKALNDVPPLFLCDAENRHGVFHRHLHPVIDEFFPGYGDAIVKRLLDEQDDTIIDLLKNPAVSKTLHMYVEAINLQTKTKATPEKMGSTEGPSGPTATPRSWPAPPGAAATITIDDDAAGTFETRTKRMDVDEIVAQDPFGARPARTRPRTRPFVSFQPTGRNGKTDSAKSTQADPAAKPEVEQTTADPPGETRRHY